MHLTSLGNRESCYRDYRGISAEMRMVWLNVLLLNRLVYIQYTVLVHMHRAPDKKL